MLILLGFVPQRQPTICSQLLFSDWLLGSVDVQWSRPFLHHGDLSPDAVYDRYAYFDEKAAPAEWHTFLRGPPQKELGDPDWGSSTDAGWNMWRSSTR